MPSETQTAFFSYCREDSGFALKLAEDLKAAGAHVWIDQLDIEPGTPWDRAVEDALNHAPRMLVVLSPVSVNSDNVRDEVSFALSRQKRVIPVLYRDCDIPFRLARLQYIDFRPDYTRGLRILLRALGVAEAEQHGPQAPVDVVGSTAVLSREEQASAEFHVQELERERAAAAERDRLISEARAEAQQKAAATEQRRAEEERRASAERLRIHEGQREAVKLQVEQDEREQAEAAQARQEQSRREQRIAEQARLQREATEAAEKARLAQEEKARKEAELKARQEQLRREEQESIERKAFDWNQPETAKNSSRQKQGKREEYPAATRAGIPKLYVWGGAAVILLAVLIAFVLARSGKPHPSTPTQVSETGSSTSAAPSSATPDSAGEANSAAATSQMASPQLDAAAGPVTSGASGPAPVETTSAAHSPVVKDNPVAAKTPVNVSKMASAATAPAGHTRVQLPPDISKTFLIHEVAPAYPPLARQARVHGVVTLKVIIDKTGAVESIKTVSGHPLLVPTAIDAVKQWRYRPFVVDDKPVEVDTVVTVKFALTN